MLTNLMIEEKLDEVAGSLASCWSQRHRSTPAAVLELAGDWGEVLASWLRNEHRLPLAWAGMWLSAHLLYEVRERAGALVRARDAGLDLEVLRHLPSARDDLQLWRAEHDQEHDWEAIVGREWAAGVRARRAAEEGH